MIAILGLGPWEILVVLFIALLLFGNRLPSVARSLGEGIVEFRKGLKGEKENKEAITPPKEEREALPDEEKKENETKEKD